jgi:hypothetical protein
MICSESVTSPSHHHHCTCSLSLSVALLLLDGDDDDDVVFHVSTIRLCVAVVDSSFAWRRIEWEPGGEGRKGIHLGSLGRRMSVVVVVVVAAVAVAVEEFLFHDWIGGMPGMALRVFVILGVVG